MLSLILNADDFGLTKGVNEAVFDLASRDALSSTTVMINMPNAVDASLLVDFSKLGIGLHFNLTEGSPVVDPLLVPTLIDDQAQFHSQREFRKRLANNRIRKEEILTELRAQFKALRTLVGDRITHIDSHQNIHKAVPVAYALIQFAADWPGLGLRSPARYLLIPFGDSARIVPSLSVSLSMFKLRRGAKECYLHCLSWFLEKSFRIPAGELQAASLRKLDLLNMITATNFSDVSDNRIFEVACHPATSTAFIENSRLTYKRLEEYKILRDGQFASAIRKERFTTV